MTRHAMTTCAALLMAALILAGAGSVAHTQGVVSALPEVVEAPADNPTTPAKVELGRLLFWDPLLSGDRDVACATCHHPQFGYSEDRDLSVGVSGVGLGAARTFAAGADIPLVKRNSQTVLNTAFNGIDQAGHYDPATAPMFWDLRVVGLEAQALEPIKALEEMRGRGFPVDGIVPEVVSRLAANDEYRAAFARAFGGRQPVTAENLARALASFERSLVATNSPFDRYMRGDRGAMTSTAVQGMADFERSGCTGCHNGPMFSDYREHVLGVRDNVNLTASDEGVNGTYAFRTPSLRNLAYTAPYMHSGVFDTLNEVVAFYDNVRGRRGGRRGGRRNPLVGREQLDPLLRQVNVRRGRRQLVAFLNALNDDSFDKTIPDRVPSGLPPGGRIQPEATSRVRGDFGSSTPTG